jgi:hypothetical protein
VLSYDCTAVNVLFVFALLTHVATFTALAYKLQLDRLLKWAGPAKDFHGLLLFDESHKVSQ